jgi:ferredoxin
MKTHSLTVVTGAVKNMFGIVSGAGKSRSHAAAPGNEDFGNLLADIFSIRPPDLTIMDAVMAMEGNGPSAGIPRHVGRLLASVNAVALDAVMCGIMGADPHSIHHLREASRLGHGPIDRGRIDVVGVAPVNLKFKLPVTVSRFRLGRLVNSGFFGNLIRSRLVLDEMKCKKCRICVDRCPADAMQMEEYPTIIQGRCIKCFCCHELCPEGAWAMKGLMGMITGQLSRS